MSNVDRKQSEDKSGGDTLCQSLRRAEASAKPRIEVPSYQRCNPEHSKNGVRLQTQNERGVVNPLAKNSRPAARDLNEHLKESNCALRARLRRQDVDCCAAARAADCAQARFDLKKKLKKN
jgi:hypothetical protein